MRWSLLLLSVVFLQCKESTLETGADIIDRSIEAHGGWNTYYALDSITIDKTIWLFDAQGSLTFESVERQYFVFKPNYQTTIVRAMDSAMYNGVDLVTFVGDSVSLGPRRMDQEVSRIKAAEFVFFQPFKLRDTTAVIQKIQSSVQFPEISSHLGVSATVKVTYPGSKDIWWFYFDDQYKCIANAVFHNGRYSLIENLEFQKSKGLLFHRHRKSYFVDSLGGNKQLRAEYLYQLSQ